MCYLQLQRTAQTYCRIFWGYLIICQKKIFFLRHCPGARSLKLNKPFQRKEGVWALLRIAVIEETLAIWSKGLNTALSSLFCFWMHPALPYRVKHFYKQLEERTLLSATSLEKRLCNHLDVSSTFMPTIGHQLPLCKERHFLFYWNAFEYDSWPLGIESSGQSLKALKVHFFLIFQLIWD